TVMAVATRVDERDGGMLVLWFAGGRKARTPMFFHAKVEGKTPDEASALLYPFLRLPGRAGKKASFP
ncbi:MAG: hypothetical protein LBC91_02770, partial [Candidatus Accumulibacter sp.]|nr:hypothetical protein [Accumulibacter sp.]